MLPFFLFKILRISTSSAVRSIFKGELHVSILLSLKKPITPTRNWIVHLAFALGFFVHWSRVGRLYLPMRRRKKNAINERSPIARQL